MKRNVTHFIVSLFLSVLLFSCISTHQYSIEVMQPAKKSLPSHIKNVTLVARNYKYDNDTIQKYYKKNYRLKKSKSKKNIDSLVVSNTLNGFAQSITKQFILDSVYTLPYETFTQRYVDRIPRLNWNKVEDICDNNNTDALVALETITYLNHLFIPRSYEEYDKTTEVVSGSVWTIYDARKRKVINSHSMVDTLYWNGTDPITKKRYKLPARSIALKDAGWYMGKKYAEQFTPHWKSVWRSIYIPNHDDFKKAKKLVDKEQWHKAVEIWLQLSKSEKKRIAFFATYNLALAAEMDGDIPKAAKIAIKAQALARKTGNASLVKETNKLVTTFVKRQADLEKIKKQIN
ncbi:hypothetical protein EMN47_10060 [Prolixibacteraceae bacterium JC049]|nr:hypothetical protein [Prolixibacteraceae bacterium JC049]